MDYVMSYSEDVPSRYHRLKAERIVKLAKKAEIEMLSKSPTATKSPDQVEVSLTESDTEGEHEHCESDFVKETDNLKMSSKKNSKKRKFKTKSASKGLVGAGSNRPLILIFEMIPVEALMKHLILMAKIIRNQQTYWKMDWKKKILTAMIFPIFNHFFGS